MNEAHSQIDGKLRKPFCVVLDALVWVGADIAALFHLEDAARRKPLGQKIESDRLTEADLQYFVQPGLRHAQAKEGAHDDDKHLGLVDETREVLVVDGVVYGTRPIVQPDLGDCVERDHERNRCAEPGKVALRMRVEDDAPEFPQLNEDIVLALIQGFCSRRLPGGGFRAI